MLYIGLCNYSVHTCNFNVFHIQGIWRRIGNRQPPDNNADVKAESDVSHSSSVIMDDCVPPGIKVEGVSSSGESEVYDEIQELTERGNGGARDPTSPSGHSDESYMELRGRSPAIPPMYATLDEAIEDLAMQ